MTLRTCQGLLQYLSVLQSDVNWLLHLATRTPNVGDKIRFFQEAADKCRLYGLNKKEAEICRDLSTLYIQFHIDHKMAAQYAHRALLADPIGEVSQSD